MRKLKAIVEEPAPVVTPFSRPCEAFGCPEIGAISPSNAGPADQAKWFCRHHFGETADTWPEITRRRRVARDAAEIPEDKPKVEVTPKYIAGVRNELVKFARTFGAAPDKKGWAKKLKARQEAGEHLLPVQEACWRIALREIA